jgi:hypothetical protein
MSDNVIVKLNEAFADVSVGDLAAGGAKLDPEQVETFFRRGIETSAFLSDVNSFTMSSDTKKMPKIIMSQPITKAAPGGTPPYLTNGQDNRNLDAAKREGPTFEQVQVQTAEYMAEIYLTDNVLEDNVEKGTLYDTIMEMAGRRIANDLEILLLRSDNPGAVHPIADFQEALRLQNGVLKNVTSFVINGGGNGILVDTIGNAMEAIPAFYQGEIPAMKLYVPYQKEIQYRKSLAARQTNLGDQAQLSNIRPSFMGKEIVALNSLPTNQGLLINPANTLLGFQRDMTIETERHPRARSTTIVIHYRAAFGVMEEQAAVKIINL